MNRMSVVVLTVFVGAVTAGYSLAEDVGDKGPIGKIDPKQNVVYTQLEGQWQTDADLNKRLLKGKPMPKKMTVGFKFNTELDKATLDHFKLYEGKLGLSSIVVGTMDLGEKKFPFMLTQVHGNPHVIYVRTVRGKLDGESFNLFVARAAKREDDILFLGGDFNNQPFMAFKRVKDEKKKEPADKKE